MSSILIIDDEEKLRGLIARIIKLESGESDVVEAGSLKAAVKMLASREFDVVICDVKLPDGNGVDFIKVIKEKQSVAEVILLTAYGNIADGVSAIKSGAFDYITKGDDNQKILPLLYKAMEKVQLARRVRQLEQQLGQKYTFSGIIGKSKAITGAVELGKRVSRADTTVLLLGETGTGKEVFAQAIHNESHRRSRPFVALNCSAFSRELLESELFGHKAGSFTGASHDKKGLFEEADTGTIFLDEIGEMAVDLQAKLLRVLETGEFFRIGDTKPGKVDVRIISATNRDLSGEIDYGKFRSDLYYRLSVFSITLPPLRERKEDIEWLARHFAGIYAVKTGKRQFLLTKDYLESLEQSQWKGNIRELKNVIERSFILAEGEIIGTECLPRELQYAGSATGKPLSAFSLNSIEKLHIQKILDHTNGNKAEAARLLEIGVATLYRKIEEYKI